MVMPMVGNDMAALVHEKDLRRTYPFVNRIQKRPDEVPTLWRYSGVFKVDTGRVES